MLSGGPPLNVVFGKLFGGFPSLGTLAGSALAGTTPPLSRLTLPVGTHQIVVRNDDFPAYSTSITVTEEKPVTLRHRFGS